MRSCSSRRRRRRVRAAPSLACSPRPACPAASSRSSTAAPQTGRALVGSAIDGVAFTGSAEVGREIGRRLSEGPFPRPVLAEMGGKNAASSARAPISTPPPRELRRPPSASRARSAARARGRSSWTRCTTSSSSGSRSSRATTSVGDPADPDVATGPVVNAQAVERFERSVEAARRDGVVAAGGPARRRRRLVRRADGRLGPPLGHRLTRDELFLPLLTVVRVPDFAAALAEANAVPYGLTAGVFSRDEDELDRFLDEIEAGVVYVNRRAGATTGAWPGIQSFCGWKSSGLTGQGRARPVLRPAVRARAEPNDRRPVTASSESVRERMSLGRQTPVMEVLVGA